MFGIGFVCLLVDLCLALGLSVILGNYVWHWLCLFVGWVTYVWVCLSVCLAFVGIMLGIGFVCLFVGWLGDLCLALRLSVICGAYVGHWVCLFVGRVTYVW